MLIPCRMTGRPPVPPGTLTALAQTAGPWNWTGWVPKIQVGLAHARKAVQVTVESDTYQITVDPRDHRHRAPHCQPGHQAA